MSIIGAFVLGGLIGAGVALLMAPQSGQETRSIIRNKGMELKDRAVGTAEETRAKAGKMVDDLANQTKERAEELRKRGQEMVDRGKREVRERA